MAQKRHTRKISPPHSCHVKPFREFCGMSQEGFAVFVGISPASVSLWERGVVNPKQKSQRFLENARKKAEITTGVKISWE